MTQNVKVFSNRSTFMSRLAALGILLSPGWVSASHPWNLKNKWLLDG